MIVSLVTLGLTGNFDRQRQNEWSFTITDNFGSLVQKTSESYCMSHLVRTEDFVYPIAGKVGLAKLIKEFTLMSLFENLDELNKDVATVKKGPPSMVQQLQFTTTIGGGASPKIVFAPKGPRSLSHRPSDWRRTPSLLRSPCSFSAGSVPPVSE
ncbi:hypothetical protein ACFFWD_33725 [Bradyrhizobium erythrophlei]|uniref:hypothetical protein n=1 Tax=Bradyrhizobium erythrophlei TaxID=1437360 RepID=UPI0035E5624C